MQIKDSEAGKCTTISIRGDRHWHDLLSVGVAVLLYVMKQYLIHSEWLFWLAAGIGGCWPLYVVFRRQYGQTILTVSDNDVAIFRSTRLFGRTLRFPRSEVEKVGYLTSGPNDDPAIGMMVHSRINPVCFGRGLKPEEATEIFSELNKNNCWLANHIVPVGTPLY